jgi:hypothetical protein
MSSIDDAPITAEVLIGEYVHHRNKRDHEVVLFQDEMSVIHFNERSTSNRPTIQLSVKPYDQTQDLALFNRAGSGVRQFLVPRDVYRQLLCEFTHLVHSVVNSHLLPKKKSQKEDQCALPLASTLINSLSSVTSCSPTTASSQLSESNTYHPPKVDESSATSAQLPAGSSLLVENMIGITEPFLDEFRNAFTLWKFRKYLLFSLRYRRHGYVLVGPLSKHYVGLKWSLLRQLTNYHLSNKRRQIEVENCNANAQASTAPGRRRGRRDKPSKAQATPSSVISPSVVTSRLLHLCCTSLGQVPTSLFEKVCGGGGGGGGARMTQFNAATWTLQDWSGFAHKLKPKAMPNNNIKQSKRKQREKEKKEKMIESRQKKNLTLIPKSRVKNCGKIDVVGVALCRLLLTAAHRLTLEGDGGMATLEAEREVCHRLTLSLFFLHVVDL